MVTTIIPEVWVETITTEAISTVMEEAVVDTAIMVPQTTISKGVC